MDLISLNGAWEFKKQGDTKYLEANVPGCNYLDLMSLNIIEDPFFGANEEKTKWVSKENWEYRKSFTVSEEFLKNEVITIVAKQLDTLCTVAINGVEIASTNNINREYIFDVKEYLLVGENVLDMTFLSPFPYIAQRQKLLKLPINTMGSPGCPHIRKTSCHFGWDFGPQLIPCGISRDIFLRGYCLSRIVEVQTTQEHSENLVKLTVMCRTNQLTAKDVFCRFEIKTPDGDVFCVNEKIESNLSQVSFNIENPKLWWCNGLGNQPLYSVECALMCGDEVADTKALSIGLRTLVLNTDKDKYGNNFCFYINGVEIFAKGANWIPADAFNTRVDEKKLRYMLGAMKNANMNLVRIWGGGYYESDLFYNICDELGIMVWQDMAFACSAYPFALEDYKENVFKEVQYNVRRLRHHASLALWCGNNEIESMSMAWSYRRKIIASTGKFFYDILPNWIVKFDKSTSYWNCSPSSGKYMTNINNDDFGDTHLWNVWHGMRDVNFYRKRYTRFCSEFGLESYPSVNCIRKVIPEEERHLKSKVLNAHQKCGDGDTKMLYYVNKRFWEPKEFSGLVYLTQLTQTECIRDATEHWRRNRNRCHGALYWQLNDNWPGTSWSSMDYYGNYKALLYKARKFNENVALSLENKWYSMKIFTLNDTAQSINGVCKWRLELFDGQIIDSGEIDCTISALSSNNIASFDFKKRLNASNQKSAVFVAELFDDDKNVISRRRAMIYRERQVVLPNPDLKYDFSMSDSKLSLTVSAKNYARFICINIDGFSRPWSDNYFDLSAGESKTVTIDIAAQMTSDNIREKLEVFSLFDVEPQMSRFQDRIKELIITLKPMNIINWIGRLIDK